MQVFFELLGFNAPGGILVVQPFFYPLTREQEMFEHLPRFAFCIVDRDPVPFDYISIRREVIRAKFDNTLAPVVGAVVSPLDCTI